jgi:chorismate mutase
MDELLSVRGSNNIDAALVFLLGERSMVTRSVGYLKARYQLPAADLGGRPHKLCAP